MNQYSLANIAHILLLFEELEVLIESDDDAVFPLQVVDLFESSREILLSMKEELV